MQCHDCAGEQCLRSIAAGISGKCPAKNHGRCFIRLEADGSKCFVLIVILGMYLTIFFIVIKQLITFVTENKCFQGN